MYYIQSMKLLIVLTLLVVMALGYKIQITCGRCSTQSSLYCFNFDGGPFDNYVVQLPSCPAGSYPIVYEFSCDKECSGCGISRTQSGRAEYSCTEFQSSTISALNQFYGKSRNNLSLTYDWCPNVCLSTFTIIIICLAGVTIIAAIIKCILRNREKARRQAQDQIYQPRRGAHQPLIRNNP